MRRIPKIAHRLYCAARSKCKARCEVSIAITLLQRPSHRTSRMRMHGWNIQRHHCLIPTSALHTYCDGRRFTSLALIPYVHLDGPQAGVYAASHRTDHADRVGAASLHDVSAATHSALSSAYQLGLVGPHSSVLVVASPAPVLGASFPVLFDGARYVVLAPLQPVVCAAGRPFLFLLWLTVLGAAFRPVAFAAACLAVHATCLALVSAAPRLGGFAAAEGRDHVVHAWPALQYEHVAAVRLPRATH